jgi:signal transduction histidine kinase
MAEREILPRVAPQGFIAKGKTVDTSKMVDSPKASNFRYDRPLPQEHPSNHFYRMHHRLLELEQQNAELRRERDLRQHMESLLGSYRELYDQAPVGYVNLDGSGVIHSANVTAVGLLGAERSFAINRSLELFLTEASRPTLHAFLSRVFLDGEKQTCEVELLREPPTRAFLQIDALPLQSVNLCRAVFSDITRRKLAETVVDQLSHEVMAQALQKEASEREHVIFNRTVAHDLRQPLNIIYAYAQALDMCCETLDDAGREHVQGILNGTLRLNRLINSLVTFSCMSVAEPRRKIIDISALARGVSTRLAQGEPDRQVEMHIGDGIKLYADYDLMTVVLENLLGNAWKFTSHRGDAVIEVGAAEENGQTVVFVRDNGVGFEREREDLLFVPFQQCFCEKKLRGFGMGLPTVARILRRHGGRVWAQGSPGEGATIFFSC